jgi:hypothetical protein
MKLPKYLLAAIVAVLIVPSAAEARGHRSVDPRRAGCVLCPPGERLFIRLLKA